MEQVATPGDRLRCIIFRRNCLLPPFVKGRAKRLLSGLFEFSRFRGAIRLTLQRVRFAGYLNLG
jgi:hypothetical protein